MRNLKIVKVMSELGAGTRGASLGYDALYIASHHAGSRLMVDTPTEEVETVNDNLFEENDTPNAIRVEGIAQMYSRIADSVKHTLLNGDFPIVIAGDHSNAGGTIAGIKDAYPDKRLGVIWIDAHADMHSPYSTPSGNVHGMPLATALGENNEDRKINEIVGKTKENWDKMKGDSPRVAYEDLVLIGVRDTEEPEDYLIAKHNVKSIKVEDLRLRGERAIADETLDYLDDCDIIYISFDVDSMDSAISVGTGTPVINGFSESETEKLLVYLTESPKICCFEMVEINPLLDDKCNKMAETAFFMLDKVAKTLQKK